MTYFETYLKKVYDNPEDVKTDENGSITCPYCNKKIKDTEGVNEMSDEGIQTYTCPYCNKDIIIKDKL